MLKTKRSLFPGAVLLSAIAAFSAQGAINYPDFSSTAGLQLNGSATTVGNVLRLTQTTSQGGSAFSTSPVSLSGASFSTFFSFRISDPVGSSDIDGQGADGIVFVVQTVANNVGGSGGGIGYAGIPKSVGIEFDTWYNPELGDVNGNHIGIDIGGNINSAVEATILPRMNDGNVWNSWIDYDGSTDTLEVRLTQAALRPAVATLAYVVDLEAVLTVPNAFVGFTSGTGSAGGDHDILQWSFRAEYDPIEESSVVPEVQHYASAFGALLIGAQALRRRFKKA
jgi:hypothetical protein